MLINTLPNRIIIDPHVHFYRCFDIQEFLSWAFRNFSTAAKEHPSIGSYQSVLIITDWAGQRWFDHFMSLCGKREGTPLPGLDFQKTVEETSLIVKGGEGEELILIAGRKIITSEDLEVLAIGCKESFTGNNSLKETVKEIDGARAIPVIPWAVGKWIGKRGKVVEELLTDGDRPLFFLCDNGNRPLFWPWPKLFTRALDNNIKVLAGSDPLHFSTEVSRAGRFAFFVEGSLDRERPTKDLFEILRDQNLEITRYGKLESPYRFFRNQIMMQIFKKKNRRYLEGR